MKRIGVKYCGGCNPQIERSRFVEELKKKLAGDLSLAIGCGTEKWELGVLVCGCSVGLRRPAGNTKSGAGMDCRERAGCRIGIDF